MKIKLLTHNDLDAAGCVILAKLAFGDDVDIEYFQRPDKVTERLWKMLTFNYKENKFEYDDYDMVFITDTSCFDDVAEVIDRTELGKKIRLFDHHASAQLLNKYEWATVKIDYLPNWKTCGTSLFYDYLIYRELVPECSYFIKLIRELDTWEWEAKDNIHAKYLDNIRGLYGLEPFIDKYVQALTANPVLTAETVFNEIDWVVINIEQNKINRYIKGRCQEIIPSTIEGYNVAVLFCEFYHSELGNEIGRLYPEYDLVAMINFRSGGISYRTRRDDVNLTEFAQKFKGGGHHKASGSPIPVELKDELINSIFKGNWFY